MKIDSPLPILARLASFVLRAVESFKPLIADTYLVEGAKAVGQSSKKRSRASFERATPASDEEEGWSTESERGKLQHAEAGETRRPPRVLVVMNQDTDEALDALLTDRRQWAQVEGRPLCRYPHRLHLVTHIIEGDEEPRWDGVDKEMVYAWKSFNSWREECLTGKWHWDNFVT